MKNAVIKIFLFIYSICFISQITDTGDKVGIRITVPSKKLDVKGNINIPPSNNFYMNIAYWNYLGSSPGDYVYLGTFLRYKNNQWESFHPSNNGMALKFVPDGLDIITAPANTIPTNITTLLRLKLDGSIRAGKLETGLHRLAVEGNVGAREIIVESDS